LAITRVYGRAAAPDGVRHAPDGPARRAARTRLAAGGGAKEANRMLKWALIFFIISVVAGYFGFTGVASTTRTVAKVLFFIALAVFLIVLVFGVMLGMLVF
jgi:uncharacterized membrane protein YtjA (UPF0391 family)